MTEFGHTHFDNCVLDCEFVFFVTRNMILGMATSEISKQLLVG